MHVMASRTIVFVGVHVNLGGLGPLDYGSELLWNQHHCACQSSLILLEMQRDMLLLCKSVVGMEAMLAQNTLDLVDTCLSSSVALSKHDRHWQVGKACCVRTRSRFVYQVANMDS